MEANNPTKVARKIKKIPTINKLKIDHNDLSGFSVENPISNDPNLLYNLSRVNIIIGTNNSGKSRLMRGIAKAESLNFSVKGYDKSIIEKIIEDSKQNFIKAWHNIHTQINDVSDILKQIDVYTFSDIFTKSEILLPALRSFLNNIAIIQPTKLQITSSSIIMGGGQWQQNLAKELNSIAKEAINQIDLFLENCGLEYLSNAEIKKYYIPILRGLRPLTDSNDYRDRTIKDYFPEQFPNGENSNLEIETGLNLYKEIRRHLLGDLKERKIVADFQEYLSREFFENKQVAIVPKEGKEELALKVGGEKEQQVYDLGDGLQSILIISFSIFKAKSDSKNFHLIFVEEPEIFIHPGLQRLLLKKMTEMKNCQFFFTTHSNHFLDITLDYENIAIFRVRKEIDTEDPEDEILPNFYIENISSANEKTLELLGVRDSAVFLSNCSIWVEGITDRMYLRHYLNLYQQYIQSISKTNEEEDNFTSFKEDSNFSFIEYGGSNLPHFNFSNNPNENITVKRISKNVLLVADNDKLKEEKHEKMKELLGDNYLPLPCREVENLATPEILRKIISYFEGKKSNSNFILKDFEYEDYKDEYLGNFIEKKSIVRRGKRKGELKYSYMSEKGSGTIRDKLTFAKAVISQTASWEEMSENAKVVTIKMFEFIKKHNM